MGKPRVATTSLAGCFGCHMSILDIDDRILKLVELIDFDRSPIDDIKHISQRCAVGLVEGVFVPPPRTPPDWVDNAALEQLSVGIRCYRWMVAERAARQYEERIACRRAIKKISPRLLKDFLESK